MNQIYIDIDKKDNIQIDDTSNDIPTDNQSDQNKQDSQIVQKESNQQNCDFCHQLTNLRTIKTIKQNYQLCLNCSESIDNYEEEYLQKYDSKLIKKIQILIPKGLLPYDVSQGQCSICQQIQILYQIGCCNHNFCRACINNHISLKLENPQTRYNINCPSCDNLIDDYFSLYITYEILPIDHLIKPKMCCVNKNCQLTIKSEPYKKLEAISLIIDNDKATCNNCAKQFCALCWSNHKGVCNFEKKFQSSLKNLGIIKCPRCNCYGQSERCVVDDDNCLKEYLCQDQYCPLCGYRFCLECLGPVQMYESVKNISGYSCYNCKKNFYKWINVVQRFLAGNFIQKIGIFILYLAVIAFLIVGCIILSGTLLVVFAFQHMIVVAKGVCKFHMKYYQKIPTGLQQTFSPFLLCSVLTSFIVVYIFTFIPALIIQIRQNIIMI
ncbi:hypothetical protein pb186bvf_012570 [Paramecium bursaria]